MFFISPIKTAISSKFYLEKLKEPLWKAFLFVAYIFALAAIFLTIYVPFRTSPIIDSGINQLAEITPDVIVANGVINANNNRKMVIDDKILKGYKIIFDTASIEPGYPTQMAKEKILLYVNKNTIYVSYNNQFQETKMEENFNFTLSKQELLNNKDKIAKSIKYVLVMIALFILLFRLIILALFALFTVFIMSIAFQLNLSFKKLLILALYLQGPVVICDFILAILPMHILGMNSVLALGVFIFYTGMIYVRLRAIDRPQVNNKAIQQEKEGK